MSFHTNFKNIMRARGLRMVDVHKGTGIPKSTLSEWSAGREPKLSEQILLLARFLGVSLEYLITGCDNSLKPMEDEKHISDIRIEGEHYQLKLIKINRGNN